jgi:outer membrane assembly lipoprotein YfiO
MAPPRFSHCPNWLGLAGTAWAVLPWLAACGGAPAPNALPIRDIQPGWTYQPSESRFHSVESGETCDPPALLERGKSDAKRGEVMAALRAFQAIRLSRIEVSLKEEALLEEARAWILIDDRLDAHVAFVEFLERYPRSSRFPGAIRESFQNAIQLAEGRGAVGVQAVRDLLNRFPREEISAEYAFRLGEYFFRQEEHGTAKPEFESVCRDYARTPWAEAALFRISLCDRRRFKGIAYDPRPLTDARRSLEKYLLAYPSGSLAGEARRELKDVKELQAQKALAVASYYEDRRRMTAARNQYAAVVKEFPDTAAADEARRALQKFPASESAQP